MYMYICAICTSCMYYSCVHACTFLYFAMHAHSRVLFLAGKGEEWRRGRRRRRRRRITASSRDHSSINHSSNITTKVCPLMSESSTGCACLLSAFHNVHVHYNIHVYIFLYTFIYLLQDIYIYYAVHLL